MNTPEKFQLNKEFKVEKFDNEILLYAVSNTRGIYLNETAYLVWEMCGKGKSFEEIVDTLQQAYPEAAAAIREDVQAAVQSLLENKVLVVDNG